MKLKFGNHSCAFTAPEMRMEFRVLVVEVNGTDRGAVSHS